jgi:hypothetical protein
MQTAGQALRGKVAVVPLALYLATQRPIGPTAQSFSLMHRDP